MLGCECFCTRHVCRGWSNLDINPEVETQGKTLVMAVYKVSRELYSNLATVKAHRFHKNRATLLMMLALKEDAFLQELHLQQLMIRCHM